VKFFLYVGKSFTKRICSYSRGLKEFLKQKKTIFDLNLWLSGLIIDTSSLR